MLYTTLFLFRIMIQSPYFLSASAPLCILYVLSILIVVVSNTQNDEDQ